MKKTALVWIGALLAVVLGLGFLRWEVTKPVQRWLGSSEWVRRGWICTVQQARWMPWGDLELSDVLLQTPYGGKLHLARVRVAPRLESAWKGWLITDWNLQEIRIDPGSWRIRQPVAQEILSAGPVAARGFARLHWRPRQILLEQGSLEGSVLRLQAEGWLKSPQQAHLVLKGSLSRPVLEGMRLMHPDNVSNPWESFEVALDGRLQAPALRFQSRFLTLVLNQPMEKNP